MKQQDCIFQKIELFPQQVNSKDIHEMIYNMYNRISFSTFPYLLYKQEHSLQSIRSFSSGNCIGFAYFMQNYLWKNHHIKSYLIGASVPDLFKQDGTPHICHCAVVIPLSYHEFYVMDGALYFIEPMYCSLRDNKERSICNSNAHRHERTTINYKLQKCQTCELDIDYNQNIPEDSLCVRAQFEAIPDQQWNYYLNEIKNPDNNIGHAFLLHKPNPFIMYTRFEDGIVKLKYKLEIDDDEMIIKEYPHGDVIYRGNTYDNDPVLMKIKRELHMYFSDFMV